MIGEVRFKGLSTEQIRRFPFNFSYVDFNCGNVKNDPGVLNALGLTTYPDELPSDAQVALAKELVEKMPDLLKLRFITELTKKIRPLSDFYSRFKKINAAIMPLVVKVFEKDKDNARRKRRIASSPHVGVPLGEYSTLFDMISDGEMITKGSSFEIRRYTFLEHGAIDATIYTIPKYEVKKVILFPDDILPRSS